MSKPQVKDEQSGDYLTFNLLYLIKMSSRTQRIIASTHFTHLSAFAGGVVFHENGSLLTFGPKIYFGKLQLSGFVFVRQERK